MAELTAGYDLDALWAGSSDRHAMRSGYAWVGVSAQRVGVDQLRGWSPTRYGDLDVTAGGAFTTDQMSYDVFSQASKAVRSPQGVDPMGGLDVERVLAIGASQSAGRMTTYYNAVLPQIESVFDGYAQIVGSAPSRAGEEPVIHVLSETDVRTPVRRENSDLYRRWEVAGSAHSGFSGAMGRAPLQERDLGEVPEDDCAQPPRSRIPLHHVTSSAYDHLARWVEDGTPPPIADHLVFDGATLARDDIGHALGGIRLSQIEVPTALNTGSNSGESFCVLFGTHIPFDDATLAELYRNHGQYVSAVAQASDRNVQDGFIVEADGEQNKTDAARSDVGKPR